MKTKNFRTKISLACCKVSENRPVLEHIYFDDGFLIATDTKILVKQSLIQHGFNEKERGLMQGKFLHRNVFDEIYRYDHVEVSKEGFLCKKKNVTAFFEFSDFKEKYVDYKKVIPNNKKLAEIDNISVDIKLITIIEKITLSYTKSLNFSFHGKSKSIVLTDIKEKEKELILLMPVYQGD